MTFRHALLCVRRSGDGQLQPVLWFVTYVLLTGCGSLQATADTVIEESGEWLVPSITQRKRAVDSMGEGKNTQQIEKRRTHTEGNGLGRKKARGTTEERNWHTFTWPDNLGDTGFFLVPS